MKEESSLYKHRLNMKNRKINDTKENLKCYKS